MVAMLRIVTFGEATISVGGEQIAPSAHRTFALALHLVAERGRAIPRALLQARLFGETDERAGGHSLRQLVYRLRQLGAPIASTPSTLSVDPEHATADYAELLEATTLTSGQLEMVAKGFLPGYAPDVSDEFLEWVDGFRSRVTLALRRKAIEAMSAARDRADWPGVARAADACLALDPLNEDAMLGQAEALAMSGSKAEALERIDRYLRELPAAAADCRSEARRLRQRIMRRVSEPTPLALREMPLVGREEEMRRLTAALTRTRTDGGGVVLVSGEPGIGKTRLLTEFERLAALSGAQTARVVCRASTSHQPLSPFIELTRMLLQMPGALGCSPEALERLQTISRHDNRSSQVPDTQDFDARARFNSLAACVVELVDSVASEGILLLCLDDIQCMDESSVEVVEAIVRSISSRACLLVLSGRTAWDIEQRWRFLSQTPRIQLPALTAAHSRAFLDAFTGVTDTKLDVTATDWVLRFGQGNPLYLQLLCANKPAADGPDTSPLAIRELLCQRIEWLQADARTVLEATSLLGRYASAGALEAVLELNPLALAALLRQLEAAGVIQQHGFVIAVAHPLITDIVATSSAGAVRTLLHHRIAQVLADKSRESDDIALLWDCADHWASAGDAERAAAVLRECAAHCVSLGQPGLAIRSLDRALSNGGISSAGRFSLLRDASVYAGLTGEWERVVATLAEMEHLRPSHNERALRSEAAVLRLDALRLLADMPPQLDVPWRTLIDRNASTGTRMRAAAFLVAHAEDYFDPGLAGRTRAEVEAFTVGAPIAEGIQARFWLIYHASFGDMRRLLEIAQEGASQLRDGMLALEHVNHYYNVAYALTRCGKRREAADLLLRLIVPIREWELTSQEAWCLTWMAWLAAESSQWLEASHHIQGAMEAARRAQIAPPITCRFVAASLALHQRDGAATLAHLACIESETSGPYSPRRLLHVTQLKVRALQLLGERPAEGDLAVLMTGHTASRALGMHDEIAAALVIALCATGAEDAARSSLSEYLRRYRRDPFPVSAELAALSERLGVGTVPRSIPGPSANGIAFKDGGR